MVVQHVCREKQELFALAEEERCAEGMHGLALLGLQVQDRQLGSF